MSTETLAPIQKATPAAIERGGAILRSGGLVIFPTETVYGLGADATNDKAVAAVFAAKGRPRFNPLIIHVKNVAQAAGLVRFSSVAEKLAAAFWPGGLTLVLPRTDASPASLLTSAGLDTLAVRVPAHPVARKLISAAGRPIAAPSANRSGRVSATRAEHAASELAGRVDLILDDGPTSVGIESTVVGFNGDQPVLLRPGAIPRAAIQEIAGTLTTADAEKIQSPGQLESHYAPGAELRLNATTVSDNEALLAFGGNVPPGSRLVLNLSPSGNLTEAAANLFSMLRQLDAAGPTTIAVMPIPQTGLGEAINDRLQRAAAPR